MAQALRHPDPAAAYRLSTLVPAPPFDLPAYLDNPISYAHEVIPSRAFQSAAPGPGVGVLFPLVPTQLTLTQSEQAILRVHTQPFRPVSFLSLDAGHFGNALVAQTVIADANGTGSVAFTAGSGTVDAVHILASSPVVSGHVQFTLWIHLHS